MQIFMVTMCLMYSKFVHRNEYRVVGFEVEAHSVNSNQVTLNGDNCDIPSRTGLQYVDPKGTSLNFFYSVKWEVSNVSWASRWDIYLGMSDVKIHWFSIIYSVLVIFFLSGN